MKTSDIYCSFMIPVNLQKHMLRVASLASVILEHWTGPVVNGQAVIVACLFHDIAKPINFDLSQQPKFGLTPEDVGKLRQLQIMLKTKYGKTEHEAAIKIFEENNLGTEAARIMHNWEWEYVPRLTGENNVASLLSVYCDMRIGPYGVLPLRQRMAELKKRTANANLDVYEKYGLELEEMIRANTAVDVDSITDTQLEERFGGLAAMDF